MPPRAAVAIPLTTEGVPLAEAFAATGPASTRFAAASSDDGALFIVSDENLGSGALTLRVFEPDGAPRAEVAIPVSAPPSPSERLGVVASGDGDSAVVVWTVQDGAFDAADVLGARIDCLR
ncbi:MAG: hypothetical protein JNL21_41250 [Myxococcales bacterium]|nr:hypothetical protein [Myxococcales bacterium]